MIPYGRQHIGDLDIAAVVDVLRSDWLTQGPAIPRFEQAVADYCGAASGVAVNSATAALHLACLALDLGPGDVLWTSPITFVASANCARFCGAAVDFVDIDDETLNMSAEALEAKLHRAKHSGRLPKVVVPVHFAGRPCDMASIRELSERYGFKIIEDASHALGAQYKSQPVGACAFSDLTVFSFHPVKMITTGEGGMVLGNQGKFMRRIERLRSHGITRLPNEMDGESHGDWYYQQTELGYNYRMTDMQAALGTSQLRKLDGFLEIRRQLVRRYNELLADLPVRVPIYDDRSAWHLYVIRLETPFRRRAVYDSMRAAGIGVNVHYIPVHLQPYYQELGFEPGDFPIAEAYYAAALTLPLYPDLADSAQIRVVEALREVLS